MSEALRLTHALATQDCTCGPMVDTETACGIRLGNLGNDERWTVSFDDMNCDKCNASLDEGDAKRRAAFSLLKAASE